MNELQYSNDPADCCISGGALGECNKVNFNKEKWNNDILPKIDNFHKIYMNEKTPAIDLFINDD